MNSKIGFALLAAFAMAFGSPSAQAQDPFGFQFGYVLGYQNSFRNRLPTPPYFSIYPPVYYGKRYERPYGDSPFASFPQLRSAPDYYPVPKEAPFRSLSVINPYTQSESQSRPMGHAIQREPVALQPSAVGKTVEIVNPFVQDHLVTQAR
jgi:hypothetical protein